MTLRLVLVSMVAALGLTIPSRMDCKRFFSSAETRASSFLAGWDTWRPGDGAGHRKPGATATRECELCRLARAQVAFRTQKPVAEVTVAPTATASVSSIVSQELVSGVQTAVPASAIGDTVSAFDPIDVEDEMQMGLAFELNRAAEAIDLVQKGTPSESSNVPAILETSREIGNIREWTDKLCDRLVREVRTAVMVVQPSEEPGCQSAAALASTAMQEQHEEPITVIGGTQDWSDILSVDTSTSVEWSPGYGPELFAAIENRLAELDKNNPPATAHEVTGLPLVPQCGQPDDSAPVTTPVAATQENVEQGDTASVQIPWPVFATEQSVSQPAPPIAEEIEVPWPVFAPSAQAIEPAIARESSTPERRWNQAVHLTREAMFAWMKVLTGPAVVDVSAR